MITKSDVVYDMTLETETTLVTTYSCAYYGVNINGISTVSAPAWDDMTSIGINVYDYILNLFMMHDNALNEELKQVVRLTLEFNSDGSLIPVFDRVR